MSLGPAIDENRHNVALVLNLQARHVDPHVVRRLQGIAGTGHTFVCHGPGAADEAAKEIIARRYQVVACAGGDGTLAAMVDAIIAACRAASRALPTFAILPLGTGNAVAHWVASCDLERDLKHLIAYGPPAVRQVSLIVDGSGRHSTFAGLGYDALLLNDFNWVRQKLSLSTFAPLAQGLGGYAAAVVLRMLPRVLHRPRPLSATVYAGPKTFFIDPKNADTAVPVPQGTVLWSGPLSLVAVGTCPYFGYGLRIFPFAQTRPAAMHLRLASTTPFQVLTNLVPLWRGTWRAPHNLFDYVTDSVEVQLGSPSPLQTAGDDRGPHSAVRWSLAQAILTLADFNTST